MKKLFIISLTAPILSLFFAGCASKLLVKEMTVEPSPVSPGDDVMYCVVLSQPSDEVKTVRATVREYPAFTFDLNNEGKDGDVKAGDNIWSSQGTIPWDAPSQTFHIDISILDNEGNVIVKEEVEGKTLDRSGTILLVIE